MSTLAQASLFLLIGCAEQSMTTELYGTQQKLLTVQQQVDGEVVDRTAIVQGSAALDPSAPVPVVFFLHGHGGVAEEWLDMSETIRKHIQDGEYIAVFPQGHLNSWNMGTEESTADDVAFLELLLDELAVLDTADTSLAYIQGISNGAGMAQTAAVQSDRFSGIAAYMTALYDDVRPQSSTLPIKVMQMHGTEDEICPYEGGFSEETGHDFLSAEASAAAWASANQCKSGPSTHQLGSIDIMSWTSCADRAEVVHYRLNDVGHNMPQDIDPFQVAWAFFRQP